MFSLHRSPCLDTTNARLVLTLQNFERKVMANVIEQLILVI